MHPGPARTRPGRRVTRLVLVVVAVVITAAAAVLAVTTSSARDTGPAPGTAAGTRPGVGTPLLADPSSEIRLRSRVTRVAGQLTDVRRDRVARRAHATVLAYLETASGGDAPWRGAVRGLRREARADAPVLRGTEELGPADARAWLSVAAPHGRAVGVTARLAVTLPPDDGPAVSVTGRLLLTPRAGRGGTAWQVFGYDLARGTR